MTEALIIGGVLVFCGLLLWALIRASEAKGVAQARAEQTRDALDAVKSQTDAEAAAGGLSSDERRRMLEHWSRD